MTAFPKSIGLYIHIPFCKSKCCYCDFNSNALSEALIPHYFKALESEFLYYATKLQTFSIKSIFIGGGTPSFVDSCYIARLMEICRQNFNIVNGAEITIESNPGTLSFEKLTAYKVSGINRLSIGLQASQNHLLKMLGRIHDFDEFCENYKLAGSIGFTNINVDLIFGVPGQTLKDWSETLKKVLDMDPAHLSCYSLKIEPGTVFGKLEEMGELNPVEDELDREMYEITKARLNEKGYSHYEISNFAKPGFLCRHNMIYWGAEEYVGVGAGAHSYFKGRRYNNKSDLNEYICLWEKGTDSFENVEAIDKEESMAEFVILGLRLLQGISKKKFEDRYGEDIGCVFGTELSKLIKKNLLDVCGDKIRLTPLGLDLANEVFVEFI